MIKRALNINTKFHDKGIIGRCQYMQVATTPRSIPLHRLVYCWFNDIIPAYNENGEKMEIGHGKYGSLNNHISNLKLITAKENRAERKGSINQYGLRKAKKVEHNVQ